MNFELLKSENERLDISIVDTAEVRFNFFKNMIKKDLEVVLWCNRVIKIFGDFQIYSECKSELNSFDYLLSFLTGKNVNFSEKSMEAYMSDQCSEFFITLLVRDERELNKLDTEDLAVLFTKYLLEATDAFKGKDENEARGKILDLDNKYFGGSDPTMYKYINLKYLN